MYPTQTPVGRRAHLGVVDKCRRQARDYEGLTRHSEAWIQLAVIHLLRKQIKGKI